MHKRLTSYDTCARLREKLWLVLKATRQHARNLATFSVIYKSTMLALQRLAPGGTRKEGQYDSFVAGLLGGYVVFGRSRSSVTQQVTLDSPGFDLRPADTKDTIQIVIYVFARVMLALAKIAVQPGQHALSSLITPEARSSITKNAWPVFASLSWASVMYIFRWYPDTVQSSLRSSMNYMYVALSVPTVWFSISTTWKRNFHEQLTNILLVQLRRVEHLGFHAHPPHPQ